MLIKTINGKTESEWIRHTRKTHKAMLPNPPEKVRIRIRDFYVKSPDREKTEVISFELFNVIARRFFLDQENKKKKDSRNLDDREFDESDKSDFSMDEYMETAERNEFLHKALDALPEIQMRRIKMYFFVGLTYEQIAKIEGCSKVAIKYSIDIAKENISKFFARQT